MMTKWMIDYINNSGSTITRYKRTLSIAFHVSPISCCSGKSGKSVLAQQIKNLVCALMIWKRFSFALIYVRIRNVVTAEYSLSHNVFCTNIARNPSL